MNRSLQSYFCKFKTSVSKNNISKQHDSNKQIKQFELFKMVLEAYK